MEPIGDRTGVVQHLLEVDGFKMQRVDEISWSPGPWLHGHGYGVRTVQVTLLKSPAIYLFSIQLQRWRGVQPVVPWE